MTNENFSLSPGQFSALKGAINSNVSEEDFNDTLRQVAFVAKVTDQDVKIISATIGFLLSIGFPQSVVGLSCRIILSRLLNLSNKDQCYLQKLGVEIKYKTGQILPLICILGQFRKSTLKLELSTMYFGIKLTPMVMSLFGIKLTPMVMSLIDNVFEIQRLKECLEKAA